MNEDINISVSKTCSGFPLKKKAYDLILSMSVNADNITPATDREFIFSDAVRLINKIKNTATIEHKHLPRFKNIIEVFIHTLFDDIETLKSVQNILEKLEE